MSSLTCRSAILAVVLASLILASAADALAADVYVVVERTPAAGEPVAVKIRASQAGPALVRAWRLANPDGLLDAGIPLDRGDMLGFLDPRDVRRTPAQRDLLAVAKLRPVLIGTPFQVPANRLHEVELALTQPGMYLVAVTSAKRTAYATLVVSDLGIVLKRSEKRVLAWAVHRTTGRPWAGVAVNLNGAGVQLAGTTNGEGVAQFDAVLPPTLDVRAKVGEHLSYGRSRWYPGGVAERRVYLHTHQSAYRPGERVEVRGIVRAVGEQDGRLALDPGVREAVVRLVAPGDKPMEHVAAAVSEGMGTFAAGFDLAEDAPTGDWAVVAEVEGRSYEAPLVVAAYRQPAFEVTVGGVTPRVPTGAETSFDVEARFYDGGRLGGAPARWQLLYQRIDREMFPEDELVKLFFGSERQAYRPTTLATGEGVLDAEGHLAVVVKAPEGVQDGALSLHVTITGPDRRAVIGTGRVAVSASPLVVDLETDRHLYGPEDVAEVRIRAERADGKPAASRAGVLVVGRAGEAGPGDVPEETWLHTLPFTTDEQGRISLEAPLAGPGHYAIRVTMGRTDDEPEGPPAYAKVHVWAVGERATPGTAGFRLDVVADRDHYDVGDTAKLLVLPTASPHPVLATVECDDLLARSLLVPGDAPPLLSVMLDEAHVPNVYASFLTVDHGRLLETTRVLRIPPRTRLLTTTVRPDAAEIDPGATSGVTVEIADSEGEPVAGAEVDVAVVDDRLFALHADPTAPIEAFFHPPRRNAVGTIDLLNWTCVGWSARTDPARERATTYAGPSAPAPADAAAPPPPSASPRPQPVEPSGSMDDAPMEAEAAEATPEFEEDGEDRSTGAVMERLRVTESAKKEGKEDAAAERVREDFRTAILWEPALRTDAAGTVRLDTVRYGDALTRWRITAHGLDAETRVGTGRAFVRTRRNVAVGVTLPRFLRAGDRVTVPLVIRNLTKGNVGAQWHLKAEPYPGGYHKLGAFELGANYTKVIEQVFETETPGLVSFRADLKTSAGTDAERRELPVLPRGILKVEGNTLFAGRGEETIEIRVPKHAEPGSITCRVSVEPAYTQALMGALPYLQEYPYGCTEQTMSRFVPLLAASETLALLGRDRKQGAAELDAMIDAGLRRLVALKHKDGGFGWWEANASDPAMTALVVRGLSRLLLVRPDNVTAKTLRNGGANALLAIAKGRGPTLDITTRASMVLALAHADKVSLEPLLPDGEAAWRALPPMAQALLLRAAVIDGDNDLVATLRGRLDDTARRADGLISWGPATNEEAPTRWQDDAIETTATVLLALLEADVRPEILDGGARWLLKARLGGDRWRSTRDTAAAVEFLAAYVRATGDVGAGRAVALALDGKTVWETTLTLEQAVAGPAIWDVPLANLTPGATFALTLRCPTGRASAGIALRYHETGPAIAGSSSGFDVSRRFFRLTPIKKEGRILYERESVTETLPAGTLVECEIIVKTPRPREYVMITSPHAGGFERVRETGMEVPGRTPTAEAREDIRDDRTMFFVARLAAGEHVFRHTLRAEHVGTFTALPGQAELMYFPDVRGNSNGELWQVTPAGPVGRAGER